MVRDGDHVETPGLSVQIHDFPDRETAVAPSRVDVKIAEEEGFVAWHSTLSHQGVDDRRDDGRGAPTRSSARTIRRPGASPWLDSASPKSTPSSRGIARRAPRPSDDG